MLNAMSSATHSTKNRKHNAPVARRSHQALLNSSNSESALL